MKQKPEMDLKFALTIKGKKKIIATALRSARMKKNISQMELAFKLGVDQNYISKIENGKVNISLETLLKVSEVLDCFVSVSERPWPGQNG